MLLKKILLFFIFLLFICCKINAQHIDISKKNIENDLWAYYKNDTLGVYRLNYILSDKGLSDTISIMMFKKGTQVVNEICILNPKKLSINIDIPTKTIRQSKNTNNYFLSYSFQNDILSTDLKFNILNRIKVDITDENIIFRFDNFDFDDCRIKLSKYVFSYCEFIESKIVEGKREHCDFFR